MVVNLKFSLLILILFSIPANSRIMNGFGFKVGLTSANQLFDYSESFILEDEKYDYRHGLNLGCFVEIIEGSYFSLLMDLSYNQKGMIEKMAVSFVDTNTMGYSSEKVKLDRRFDYLTFSTDIKTRYELNNFSPYFLVGFKYDILLKKKIEKLYDSSGLIKTGMDAFWEKYKGNIYGLKFGVGIEVKNLIAFPIILEWIYNHDISKVKMHENLEIQNLSNELRIGIKF